MTLGVLVLSYCWVSKFHPDPVGEQLQSLLPILEVMVSHAKQFHACSTIGVLQDFGSFPQWPRSEDEAMRFRNGLKKELNEWYARSGVPVLMLDIPPTDRPEHTNRRLYSERGWCFAEK